MGLSDIESTNFMTILPHFIRVIQICNGVQGAVNQASTGRTSAIFYYAYLYEVKIYNALVVVSFFKIILPKFEGILCRQILGVSASEKLLNHKFEVVVVIFCPYFLQDPPNDKETPIVPQ